jgi:hypothetical protein
MRDLKVIKRVMDSYHFLLWKGTGDINLKAVMVVPPHSPSSPLCPIITDIMKKIAVMEMVPSLKNSKSDQTKRVNHHRI